MMPKVEGLAALTAEQVEDRRRKVVFESPPSPSTDKVTNMTNAFKWRSWGWSMIDAYTKAGVSKKSFKRYRQTTCYKTNRSLHSIIIFRALADIEKGGNGLDLKGGRRPLLSETGVVSLNQELLISAKDCGAVARRFLKITVILSLVLL